MALNAASMQPLERLCEESLALCRQLGERWREAETLHLSPLGMPGAGKRPGDVPSAKRALAICREIGEWGGTSVLLLSLGCFAWRQGDLAGAQQYVEESLAASQQSAMPVLIAPCLIWLGIILVARGQPTSAARLWGTAERVGEPLGVTAQQLFDLPLQRELDPAARTYYAQAETTARAVPGRGGLRSGLGRGTLPDPRPGGGCRQSGGAGSPTGRASQLDKPLYTHHASLFRVFRRPSVPQRDNPVWQPNCDWPRGR